MVISEFTQGALCKICSKESVPLAFVTSNDNHVSGKSLGIWLKGFRFRHLHTASSQPNLKERWRIFVCTFRSAVHLINSHLFTGLGLAVDICLP